VALTKTIGLLLLCSVAAAAGEIRLIETKDAALVWEPEARRACAVHWHPEREAAGKSTRCGLCCGHVQSLKRTI